MQVLVLAQGITPELHESCAGTWVCLCNTIGRTLYTWYEQGEKLFLLSRSYRTKYGMEKCLWQ